VIPDRYQTPAVHQWLLRGVVALVVVAVGSCFAIGASRPADPHLLPAAVGLGGHSRPTSRVRGFGQINFRVVSAHSGRAGPLRCALLADKPAAQHQGMKGRHDLAGYDAMIFRWTDDSQDQFVNEGVPIPISVAWFDADGVLIATADMPACLTHCPTYSVSVPFRMALEVPRGGLSHLGISAGSVLQVGSGC